jgi:outer membrane receptor protein involved in Fe transport
MYSQKFRKLKRSRLSAALLSGLLVPAIAAQAQDASGQGQTQQAQELDRVTVTGSLIPMSELETATPVTVITAEDLQSRGFVSVADALQQSSFATGGIQGEQTSASFTQGAETLSLFGLSPSYVKYLIDGRPMADYPALYNGSDAFNNISGVPIDLVDRIEILPGGQSSLYGSDAIAGVVNIILKKQMDGTAISLRGGAFSEGGGSSIRGSIATGFSAADDRLQGLIGLQYEERDPVWGYQRDITSRFYENGVSPALASRDFLVVGATRATSYQFLDPANCANVSGLFGDTVDLRTRPGFGDENYCGSFFTPGYRTIRSGRESGQVYTHVTFDFSENVQLYSDVLYNRQNVDYHIGSNYTWWGTGPGFGYFYDPEVAPNDVLSLQRSFAPEEMGIGGFRNTMSTDKTEAYAFTIGARGRIGESNWDYDLFGSRTEYELVEHSFARFADEIDAFFVDRVLGPQLGVDPLPGLGIYPVFNPDYAAFYSPITPEEFASFTGYTDSESKTTDNTFRALATNSALFGLPGGDAGFAFALEGGRQSWEYRPDPRLLDGSIWGTTAVQGRGSRSRYAATAELRLPVLETLTTTLSGRYDAFNVEDQTIDKPTYSVSLEFRPFESLLLRGKYGTAFKAPTLADLYQGPSGYYSSVTDYYNCQLLGFGPGNIDACPAQYSARQFFGTQSGSTELRPINADTWNVGIVWSPIANLGINVDYFSFDLEDEVEAESADQLARQEARCRTGQDDINSATCVNALSKVIRDATGQIDEILTPKVNVARQQLRALTAGVNYLWEIGAYGSLRFNGSYTNVLEHTQQTYPGDPEIDLLREPFYSTDPKTKANASVTWSRDKWGVTAYVNRLGKQPNYQAALTGDYGAPNAGTLAPWILYNLSVDYRALPNLQLSLLVNNVLNTMPEDRSYPGTSGAPYNESNVNPFGRAIYAEMRYSFGSAD